MLAVLSLALQRLHDEPDLSLSGEGEEDIDQRFYLKARDVYFGLRPEERPQGFNLFPKPEQSPVEESDLKEDWLRKRPDFKWRMQDDSAATPDALSKDFDIESKRLGKPTSPSWILIKQYVTEGIIRFLSNSHRYGNNVLDGAMIGYVQDWDVAEILREVNKYVVAAEKYAIPRFRLNNSRGAVKHARQRLKRSEVAPADFLLHHLWVDLRSSKCKR